MSKVEESVFISYRRTNVGFALAVYQNLKHYGYDVFLDYTGINAGDFEQIIVANIKSRAHFLVLLTPSALERCNEPGDWLRREIETAIDSKRNIIPLTFEGFDWGLAQEKYLTGKLATLSHYNALRVPMDFFEEAMERLRSRYLNISLDLVLHPVNKMVEQAVEEQQKIADAQPHISDELLSAENWYEKGITVTELGEKIRYLSLAIDLNPYLELAYIERASAWYKKGEYNKAIADYNEVITLNPHKPLISEKREIARKSLKLSEIILNDPENYDAYFNRAALRYSQGDYGGVIADCNEAIRIKSSEKAYHYRGLAWEMQGDFAKAIEDFDKALQLKPDDVMGYKYRASLFFKQKHYENAIPDYSKIIELLPNDYVAYNDRGESLFAIGKYDDALSDFQATQARYPKLPSAIGGLAVTSHKLDRIEDAKRYWRNLEELDKRYNNAGWTADMLRWPDAMRDEAQKLVEKL